MSSPVPLRPSSTGNDPIDQPSEQLLRQDRARAARGGVWRRFGARVSGVRALCLSLGVLALATGAAAEIQKTVSADGVIELTNRRPRARTSSVARKRRTRPKVSPRRALYEPTIRRAARVYRLPPALISAVIHVESHFNPEAVSSANAQGLMQLIPSTAERMLVRDTFDPNQNIFGGARYLRVLANRFGGDLRLTLAAYNAGEGAVSRYKGIPPYPETQAYVRRVLKYYNLYQDPL